MGIVNSSRESLLVHSHCSTLAIYVSVAWMNVSIVTPLIISVVEMSIENNYNYASTYNLCIGLLQKIVISSIM